MRIIYTVCGYAEAAFVSGLGALFFVSRTSGTQNVDSNAHVVLAIMCFIFALCIGFATYGAGRGVWATRTPFILLQVFIDLGAYLGVQSDSVAVRVVSWIVLIVSWIALYAVLYRPRSE